MGRPRPRRRTGTGRAPAPRLAISAEETRDISRLLALGEVVEERPDGDWMVRRITGTASTKPYRCPGCDQLIRPATPHVVAWPADAPLLGGAAVDSRRHWHTLCWDRRLRRR